MIKAKEYIKGCILGSAVSLIIEVYNYYISANETYVLLSFFSCSALTCSIVVWRELRKQGD
jgi:hypothetical protein